MVESKVAELKDFDKKPSKYFRGSRREMLEFLPKEMNKCLDIGCGEGLFGEALKATIGCEVWGLEVMAEAGAVAASRLDKVLIGDAVALLNELPDGEFDCVSFNDSLEHFVDPYSLLENIKSKLTSRGVIICSIPNVRHHKNLYNLLFKKQWRYEDAGILDKTHLRFFTEKSIIEMFEILGFEIVVMKGLSRTRRKKIRLLNFLTLGWLSDTLYSQFGCKVRLRHS